MTRIGVPKEVQNGERRVATTPPVVEQLLKLGFAVSVESGAGDNASYRDQAYRDAGAEIVDDTAALWAVCDIILKVRAPQHHPQLNQHEADLLKSGQTLISFIWPAQNAELMEQLAGKGVNVLAMDSVPRISRAQKCDALSSMANIAGYRAVVEAANHFGRFFTGQITAAGKVPPAKVMVIGAGVAGLAAIGAAGSLGAIVRAFDTRPEVKEQVESMEAEFLELDYQEEEDGSGQGGYAKEMSQAFIDAEMKLFREQAAEVDIIITTALIPGRPAPKLILADMLELMKDGSVIVDLASEQGGNCELTEPGQVVVKHGVTIVGHTDLPSRLPTQASQLYATNLRHLLTDLTPDKNGEIVINMDDAVIRGTTVIHAGEITWPPPAPKLSAAPKQAPKPLPADLETEPALSPRTRSWLGYGALGIGLMLLLAVGAVAPPAFLSHFIVFVLACLGGGRGVWSVTPALHTPLMSVTNAISGIIVIGALLQMGASQSVVVVMAFVATLIATINICGGFLVTQRMLKMFVRED